MRIICFDIDLYRPDAIKQAVDDYSGLATISVYQDENSIKCHVTETRYELDETCREFSNYVLELSVKMGDHRFDYY